MPEQPDRLTLRDNSTGRWLILTTLSLLALGVVMVHSAAASVARPGVAWYARVDMRHTVFALLAAVILATLWRVDYRRLVAGRRLPVVAAVLLVAALICGGLVFVPGVGVARGGCRRWIRLLPAYGLGFQPSELIKLALVTFLAAWLSRESVNVRSAGKVFLPALVLIGACVGLVIVEDLGTGMIIALSAATTLLLAGVPVYYLLSLVPPAAGVFYFFIYNNAHRWQRIQAMLNPWDGENPCAYQAGQSLLAILSGGWAGKGVGGGTLKLGFLPEDTTDFVFSVFCEEWGFIGAVLLMGLTIVWMWHARRAATRAADRFGTLLAGSLGFVIAVQTALHIAVDTVAAPPTGMSLPFVSAGGSGLLVHAAAAAMIVSVTARAVARPTDAALTVT